MSATAKHILLFVFVLIFLRVPSYVQPFMDSDEAIYGAVALTMEAGGEPYRDAIERKTPFTYFFYLLAFKIFGVGNMLGVHLMLTLWLGLSAFLVYVLACELVSDKERGRRIGFAASWIYIVSSTFFKFEMLAANCEMLMDPFLLLAWLGIVKSLRSRSIGYALLAGLGFGCSFLVKQTAVFPFAAAGLLILLGPKWKPQLASLPRHVLSAIAGVGGFALVVAASYLYFYSRGVHSDYFLWAWQANFDYVSYKFPFSHVFLRFLLVTGLFSLALFPFIYLVVKALRRHRMSYPISVLLLWVGFVLTGLWTSGKFFAHYYFHLIAPLALLGGFGWVALQPKNKRILQRTVGILAIIFWGLWFFKDPLHEMFGYRAPDYQAIANEVRATSGENDRIFVWGYSPEIYVLARRTPAARFVFCDYLSGRISRHPRVEDPDFDTLQYAAPGAWEMLKSDLASNKPRLFIDTSPGNLHQYGKYPHQRFPYLKGLVAQQYEFHKQVEGADIYIRTD